LWKVQEIAKLIYAIKNSKNILRQKPKHEQILGNGGAGAPFLPFEPKTRTYWRRPVLK
jgi:hypothetical protein